MAQATILAAGTTAATSSDVVVAAGATVTLGIFTDGALSIPANEGVIVFLDTPGTDIIETELTGLKKDVVISGPCTIRCTRRPSSVNIGVFTES